MVSGLWLAMTPHPEVVAITYQKQPPETIVCDDLVQRTLIGFHWENFDPIVGVDKKLSILGWASAELAMSCVKVSLEKSSVWLIKCTDLSDLKHEFVCRRQFYGPHMQEVSCENSR